MKDARKRNFYAILLDGVFFNLAAAFLEPGSLLPAFVSRLTESKALIGLTVTVRNCGWLLPQLWVVGYSKALKRKKPLILAAAAVARIGILILAVTTYLYAGRNTSIALIIFFVTFSMFSLCDGITGVPWVEVIATNIDPRRRGMLLGRIHFFGGILAFGAGFVVKKYSVPEI